MKWLTAVLLVLVLAQSASAAPKTVAARKPDKPDPVAQSYAALPPSERVLIETDLIWTGDYNGVADGEFGERAIAAVKAFQKRSGGKETGVLNPPERAALAAAAKTKAEAVGWRLVEDQVTGARLGIPAKLVPQASQIQNGSKFTSARGEVQIETFRIKDPGTSIAAVFDERRKDPARTTDYSVSKPELFVISGLQSGVKKFYERGEIKNGEVRGFTALYDLAVEGTMDRVTVAMSSAFLAFPNEVAGPAVHRQVEYATGILINEVGDLITDRRATEGCFVLLVAGYGPAERIAEDKAADLAVLHLYGTRKLSAVPIAGAGAEPSEVTIVGVHDPQAQSGGDAVSTLRGHLGPPTQTQKRALEPAPAPGFSGAAALDAAGHLVGMVALAPPRGTGASAQAVVIPSALIRTFLDKQGIPVPEAPPAHRDGGHPGGVARIICARKWPRSRRATLGLTRRQIKRKRAQAGRSVSNHPEQVTRSGLSPDASRQMPPCLPSIRRLQTGRDWPAAQTGAPRRASPRRRD